MFHEQMPFSALRRFELRRLIPGLEKAQGPLPGLPLMPASIGPAFASRLPSTWEELGVLRVGELAGWKGVGERKVRAFLRFIEEQYPGSAAAASAPEEAERTPSEDAVLMALRDIAAWGTANGERGLTAALERALEGRAGAPEDALALLSKIDLYAFAGDERVARWDPVLAAERLLLSLEAREQQIARHRILVVEPKAQRTLESLGEEFGVTRERVRQLEAGLRERLRELMATDTFGAIRRRATELQERLGIATPVSALPEDVRPDDEALVDELLLWAAGPYHLADGWVLRDRWRDLEAIVDQGLELAGDGRIADRPAFELACVEFGVPEEHVPLLIHSSSVNERDGRLFRWPRSMSAGAALILELNGHPMAFEQLMAELPGEVHIQSFRNALHADADIVRIGKGRYALAAWDHAPYSGLVTEMENALASREPLEISTLAEDLAGRFGTQPSSVYMNATMHPRFVAEQGWVRLRRPDEPYLPKGRLELESSCFIVDGVWALRVVVDSELLRGSGQPIPEAFGVHLGLLPGVKGALPAEGGPISAYWSTLAPHLGGLRGHARALGLDQGDALFVKRISPDRVDITGVLQPPPDASADARLRAWISAPIGPDWKRALAAALGFGGLATPDLSYLEAKLSERKDHALLSIVEELVAQEQRGLQEPKGNAGPAPDVRPHEQIFPPASGS